MVLDKLYGGVQIALVELVRDVPADGSELSPLLDSGVQEGHAVEHWLPHGHVAVLQLFLTTQSEIHVIKYIYIYIYIYIYRYIYIYIYIERERESGEREVKKP